MKTTFTTVYDSDEYCLYDVWSYRLLWLAESLRRDGQKDVAHICKRLATQVAVGLIDGPATWKMVNGGDAELAEMALPASA